MPAFQEDLVLLPRSKNESGWNFLPGIVQPMPCDEEAMYRAMMLGLRDFVNKNAYKGVVLGLSGGIDSALSAAVAVDALGKDRVRAVMLPSPFTSRDSIEDATESAQRLDIRLDTISIEPGMQAFEGMLNSFFGGAIAEVITGSNQPRLRGAILMAISHAERRLLLTTGNKSELAAGYMTLYGDMCGHYCVLKDIYKTTVYRIAKWRNAQNDVIPQRSITKAPTAELKLDQTDQDTLPPYELLDAILIRLIEGQRSIDELVAEGFDRATVERVSGMVFAAEYKRRQAAPGVKMTHMSFDGDRRYPITDAWWVQQLMP